MAEQSVLSQLRVLDQQRQKLLGKAKTEAMGKVEAALRELNGLGFNYRISEGAERKRRGPGKASHTIKNAPCPVCGFLTSPPHDARAHRMQGNKKKAFTEAELTAKSLKKV